MGNIFVNNEESDTLNSYHTESNKMDREEELQSLYREFYRTRVFLCKEIDALKAEIKTLQDSLMSMIKE